LFLSGSTISVSDILTNPDPFRFAATPEELIVFDDLAVLSADGSDFAIGTEQVIVFRGDMNVECCTMYEQDM
jgi:hypothetical protein